MRLFIAVWPPASVVEVLRAFERPTIDGVRWTEEPQWHVTLRFLGSVDDALVPAVGEALAETATSHRRRTAVLGPETACFRRSVLMVPVSGLDDLAAATVAATASFGEPPDDRPFAGHLTLARSRSFDLRRFSATPLVAEWPVDELTLVRSTTASTGAVYDVLGRWPLA